MELNDTLLPEPEEQSCKTHKLIGKTPVVRRWVGTTLVAVGIAPLAF